MGECADCNALRERIGSLEGELASSKTANEALQAEIDRLKLERIALYDKNNILQAEVDSLQLDRTASNDINNISKAENEALNHELTASKEESAVNRKQLDEMSEKYQKLSNASGIDKLRELFKQLSPSQIDALYAYTTFRVDTFETTHEEQQAQCTKQFVQLMLTQLKQSVDEIVQLRKNTLVKMEQAKDSMIHILTSADASETLIAASTKPSEAKIERVKAHIEGWNQFLGVLIVLIDESHNKSDKVKKNFEEELSNY